MSDFDPYGLWSWNETWGGTRDVFWGASSYLWEGACGLGHCAYRVGELGYSGLQTFIEAKDKKPWFYRSGSKRNK